VWNTTTEARRENEEEHRARTNESASVMGLFSRGPLQAGGCPPLSNHPPPLFPTWCR
jgi:hypothetical protein